MNFVAAEGKYHVSGTPPSPLRSEVAGDCPPLTMTVGDTQISGYRRRVSSTEWLELSFPVTNANVVQLIAEGVGPLGLAELSAAVATASKAYPGAHLARKGRMWIDSGRPPVVRLVNRDPDHPQPIPDLPELHQALSVKDGPTCEVLLVTGSPCAVIFRVAHAVMDVKGAQMWAQDIFRALRGDEVEGAPDPIGSADAFAHITDAIAGPKFPVPRGWLLGPSRKAKPLRTICRRRTVDGYHPALVARVATAMMRYSELATARFTVGVDLRRHLTGVRSTAHLSWAVELDIRAGNTWAETQQQLLTTLNEKQELANLTSIVNQLYIRTPLPLARGLLRGMLLAPRGQRYSTALLTHLGRLELADFSAPLFEASSVYALVMQPMAPMPDLMMVEVGGRTELTLACQDGPGVAERADAVLDCIEEELAPKVNQSWERDQRVPLAPEVSVAQDLGALGVTVVQRFAEQVAKTPDAIAISGPEGDVSYAELELRSRVIAAELRSRGVGCGSLVGLLAGRSVAAIAAIWGVLRVGAAYMPLNVAHPDVRLAGLLIDGGVGTCLVQAPHDERGAVPASCDAVVLDCLDYTHPPAEWVDAPVAADDRAYVIYTSGSTGKPKGVEIEHGGLLNYVQWTSRELGVDASTRMPLIVALSFDPSGMSIFLPLLAGGVLVLIGDEVNHTTLRNLLEHSSATVLSLTPSHLELICKLDIKPVGVKVVKSVGEVLKRSMAVRAQEMFGPECRIINHYGPTEVTVECTMHVFDTENDFGAGVPIGLPMDNCSVVLLDSSYRRVAVGEPGEMYLGGVQLARGYLGRPDLDRENFRFLADGSRVYRTGDIARVLPGGALEFMGRIDDQVKVLGHRIEPAEITQCLETHPSVLSAAVIVRNRPGQDTKTLCAYVVCRPDSDAHDIAKDHGDTTSDHPAVLEAYLAERLPAYMVPGAIVVVDEIPRNVNGKVDGKALPDPFATRSAGVRTSVQRDEVGTAVAAIWAHTLRLEPDRLDDDADFHELGGNSLQLLTIVAGICNEVLGADSESAFMAGLGQLVQHTTLEQITDLARKINAGTVMASTA
jgi:amino acid adenylation domain-containing protein